LSIVCLFHSGALDDRQLTHSSLKGAPGALRGRSNLEWRQKPGLVGWIWRDTTQPIESELVDHPMRDRLLDG
jgi:hypothetical protein